MSGGDSFLWPAEEGLGEHRQLFQGLGNGNAREQGNGVGGHRRRSQEGFGGRRGERHARVLVLVCSDPVEAPEGAAVASAMSSNGAGAAPGAAGRGRPSLLPPGYSPSHGGLVLSLPASSHNPPLLRKLFRLLSHTQPFLPQKKKEKKNYVSMTFSTVE